MLFCKLSPLQSTLYNHFLRSKVVTTVLSGNSNPLASITELKKLCNDPAIIWNDEVCECMRSHFSFLNRLQAADDSKGADRTGGFAHSQVLFPADFSTNVVQPQHSGNNSLSGITLMKT